MSIIDLQAQVSDAQDLVGATDEVSTNTLDIDPNASGNIPKFGDGTPIWLIIKVLEDFAGGTSVNFQLLQDDDAALASPVVLAETGIILTAALLAGSVFALAVPPTRVTLRYLGANYDKDGTFTGSNTVDAWFGTEIPSEAAIYMDDGR